MFNWAIHLYFLALSALGPTATGYLPLNDPLAPPGPEGPRAAIVQPVEINGLRVSSCGPQW